MDPYDAQRAARGAPGGMQSHAWCFMSVGSTAVASTEPWPLAALRLCALHRAGRIHAPPFARCCIDQAAAECTATRASRTRMGRTRRHGLGKTKCAASVGAPALSASYERTTGGPDTTSPFPCAMPCAAAGWLWRPRTRPSTLYRACQARGARGGPAALGRPSPLGASWRTMCGPAPPLC